MQQEIGATLIMVTHDREAASRLDHQVYLRDGRVS
jgi:predicted ABC-type transport system involved in lysophospholipase L1 biosynthesis ATPase subunit